MKNKFYVYVYLDPRKPGKYEYDGGKVCFDFQPYYVGKGCDDRWFKHLEDAIFLLQDNRSKQWIRNNYYNHHKINKIFKIFDSELDPIVEKYYIDLTEQEAIEKEIELIWVLGRYDLNMGPLTNLTWGGDGAKFHCGEFRERHLKGIKKYHASEEGKIAHKEHGRKRKEFFQTEEGILYLKQQSIKKLEY